MTTDVNKDAAPPASAAGASDEKKPAVLIIGGLGKVSLAIVNDWATEGIER